MRGLLAVVGLLALVSSCGFNPHPKDGKLPCDNGCPSGYVCGEGNRCWLNGANPDASSSGGGGGSSIDALVGTGGTSDGGGATGTGGGGGGMGGSGGVSGGGSSGAQSGTGTGGVVGQPSTPTGGTGGQSVTGIGGIGVASGGSGVGGSGTGGTSGAITTGGATRTGGTGAAGGPGGAGGSGGSSGGGGTTVAGGTIAIGGTTKTGGTTVTGGIGANTGGGGNADTGGSMSTAAGGTSSAGGTITVTCPAATSYPACSLTTGVVTGNACAPNPLMFALDANCNIGLWASDGISNGYFYQPWCNNLTTTCTLTMACATNLMHITGSYLGGTFNTMDGNAGWGANLQVNSSDAGLGCQMIDGTRLAGLTLDVNVTTIPAGNHLYVGINLANGNSAYYTAVLTAGAQTVRIPWACFKNEKACGSIPGPGITSFYYTFDWFSDAATHAVDITLSNIGFY
jgi:hypothetical protein